MGLMHIRHTSHDANNRVLFVSTHLARNPENLQQRHVRVRQVSQLMVQLRDFAQEHNCLDVPVIVAGDWNAESMQRLRSMAFAIFYLQNLLQETHPLLLGGLDVSFAPPRVHSI